MQVVLLSQQLFSHSTPALAHASMCSKVPCCSHVSTHPVYRPLFHAVNLLASYPGSQFLKCWEGGGGWKALHGEHCHLIYLILPQVHGRQSEASRGALHWKCLYHIPRLYKPGPLFQKPHFLNRQNMRPSQGFYFYIVQDCSKQFGSGIRPYCIVIATTPTFAHSLVQVSHKCGTAMAVPAL